MLSWPHYQSGLRKLLRSLRGALSVDEGSDIAVAYEKRIQMYEHNLRGGINATSDNSKS